MATTPIKMKEIFSNVMQTIIAAGIIWVGTQIVDIKTKVAAMEERTTDIRPSLNSLQLSQEDMKMRLIRLEDNKNKNVK